MQTHSMFSKSKTSQEKEKEKKGEIIEEMLIETVNLIHNRMEKEKKSLIETGMPPAEAANLIAKKQEKLQLEALENFERGYKAICEKNKSPIPTLNP